MAYPEVALDRYIRTELRRKTGFFGYVGKLDIERIEPEAARDFLRSVQDALNEALRRENVNASGGTEHPPFHFDYIQIDSSVANTRPANAHAFQHAGFSFIVVTLPMVELLWQISQLLSRSPLVRQLLRVDATDEASGLFQRMLFQLQLGFLVSHEYTHHVHRHCSGGLGTDALWTEFMPDEKCGTLDSQAQELDADGYGTYIALTHLIRGEWREGALSQLGQDHQSGTDCDKNLLTCFFLAVMSFFCSVWDDEVTITSVYRSRHPAPPVRITHVIRVAEMWCDQYNSIPKSWFVPSRFQRIVLCCRKPHRSRAEKELGCLYVLPAQPRRTGVRSSATSQSRGTSQGSRARRALIRQ